MTIASSQNISELLCSALTDMGFIFHWEADNRGGKRSRYIFVRKPIAAKIRVSTHKSDRIEKEKDRSKIIVMDVGPHAMSWQQAVETLKGLVP